MPRLLFEKKGKSVWISHLDLMRLFQRAFKRAGMPLTHTHGFNPRASVSIALPLSVGVESNCELLDFELTVDSVSCEEIKERLNCALVDGVKVLAVYPHGRKLRELTHLQCEVKLKYNNLPANAEIKIAELFKSESIILSKKTKSGVVEQDIIPMIDNIAVNMQENTVLLSARICCQNPTLNPMQLVAAVEKYLPELTPDFYSCVRTEIYDNHGVIFR